MTEANGGGYSSPGVLASAWRHRVLVGAITLLFGAAALAVTVLRPDQYVAQATLVLEDPELTSVLGTVESASGDRLVANQLEVIRSGVVAVRASQLAGEQGVEVSPGGILGGATFSTLRGTDVINIGYASSDQDEAEVVANSIVSAYDQVQREQRREANASVQDRLDSAEAVLRAELQDLTQEIDAERSARSLSTQIDEVLNRISLLEQQVLLTTNADDRQELIDQLEQLDLQLGILQSAAEVESERANLAALLESRNAVVQRLAEIDSRRSEIDIQTEIEGSGISFFSPATATEVSSGSGLIFSTLGGLFLGFLASVGLAYSLTNWRRGFTDWSEPESVLAIPFLAEIPAWDEDEGETLLPVRDDPRSITAEAFRFATANLDVRLEQEQAKSVAFASAMVGDGKSTLVANIAAAAARTKRVLVVDADFGSQAVTKMLLGDVRLGPGLTELASGRADLRSAVTRVGLSSDIEVHLIGRGLEPVLAPDFFSGKALQRALQLLSDTYDLVLIDGPPLLQVAYASTLSRLATATVIVVPHGTSHRAGAEMIRRLRFLDANVIGYIYNQAPRRPGMDVTGGSMKDVLGDRGLVDMASKPRSSRRN
jgi:succinoglycan biosynthesis transport protein ExoP